MARSRLGYWAKVQYGKPVKKIPLPSDTENDEITRSFLEKEDEHIDEEQFSQAGAVEEAVVIKYPDTGRSKGFGFVTFTNDEEADKAVEMFNEQEMEGRALKVNEARPREERPRNSFGGQGGGGGGGYNREN